MFAIIMCKYHIIEDIVLCDYDFEIMIFDFVMLQYCRFSLPSRLDSKMCQGL